VEAHHHGQPENQESAKRRKAIHHQGHRPGSERQGIRGLRRPVGLRQIHPAALIAGLEEVSGGTIELDGRDITEVSPAKRDLAMVFQTYALYPHMSVRKNMSFALDLAGVPKPKSREGRRSGAHPRTGADAGAQAEAAVRRPAPARGHRPRHRAQPEDFLFDEPLSNLDAALRVQMRLELRACTKTCKRP
jgi:ABC-type Fe3+/spermidine/putrescine transport system ATPase subunit